jgi:pimeloyl-ACP methyl ester carboxylesterase
MVVVRSPLVYAILVLLAACHGDATVPAGMPGRASDVRLPDVSLHIVEVGVPRGRVVLAIHDGPGLDHHVLRPWLDALAGARRRVVYVDLRGHGRSGLPADANGYTVVAAAADLDGLVARIEPTAPVDVVGHGFGAAVAVELAAMHPERVRRLVLVAPLRDGAQVAGWSTRAHRTLGDGAWGELASLMTPQGTLRDPSTVTAWFERSGRMLWHRVPSHAVLSQLGADVTYRGTAAEAFGVDLARWDARLRAPDVRAPTLVITGDDDNTTPPRETALLAERLPHGRLTVLPGSGHLPFVETPERFRAAVEAFLVAE